MFLASSWQRRIFIYTFMESCRSQCNKGINGPTARMQLCMGKLSLGLHISKPSCPLLPSTQTLGHSRYGASHQPQFYTNKRRVDSILLADFFFSTNKNKTVIYSNYMNGKHRINVPHPTKAKVVLKSRQTCAELTLYIGQQSARRKVFLLLLFQHQNYGLRCWDTLGHCSPMT